MKKNLVKVILAVFLILLQQGCFSGGENRITNVRIYQNTPVWELAKAVNTQNTKKIARIAKKNPEFLDYQDPQYGTALLFWAVGMEKYKSAEALLKGGADPDIISIWGGGTALYLAAEFSFIGTQTKKDSKYVKLLLEYGADPNMGYVGSEYNTIYEISRTPLMASIGCGLEKTKVLVEGGADINFATEMCHQTAAITALRWGEGTNVLLERREYAYYLIAEKKADITQPYYNIPVLGDRLGSQMFPVDLLRDWICELGTEEYEWKMAMVEEFARQGVDYWSTEIPERTLERIKSLYPDTWEEYIKVY